MKIAIHAADLDYQRIDGTRVYLLNMLKNFGKLDAENSFSIYHKSRFNPKLEPPKFQNYFFGICRSPIFWTQTGFAFRIFRENCDVLWMPVQNLPVLCRKNLMTVVTIHDLAFKIFPEHFTKKDFLKLSMLAGMAIKFSDKIIAISASTKRDILKFYPHVPEKKISVVHNGFDSELFSNKYAEEDFQKISRIYKLKARSYLLYVGAIQPRKNLRVLIEAFEKIREQKLDLKLVIAGEPAWKQGPILERISDSPYSSDIVVTGTVPFEHLPVLYKNASVFVFPSLYEGFGIPILEAMASGTPVICADNSSLPEVAGPAALYFNAANSTELAEHVKNVVSNEKVRDKMVAKGLKQAKKFSWYKCAKETLEILHGEGG